MQNKEYAYPILFSSIATELGLIVLSFALWYFGKLKHFYLFLEKKIATERHFLVDWMNFTNISNKIQNIAKNF